MPIYEYACDSCHNRFEIRQKLSDPPLTTCSQCGHVVKKLISSPAIMFKGTGWYVTDYSEKMKPPASAETGESKTKAEEKTPAGEAKTAAAATGNGTPSTTSGSSPASSSGDTPSGGSNTPTPTSSSNSA